jgi:predicted DCC family thiol-disulfide oxidoreductase YuxK
VPQPDPELLFYDGGCGFCHRAVRFVLAHDPAGAAFRFAPIGGETFEAHVPPERSEELPDSILVERSDGTLLARSDALVHILRRLGGGWELLGRALARVPRPMRDALYDFVARHRLRWFRPPEDACPVLPPDLRARFES